jgi:tRNA acetyltransferase TAN1
MVPPKYRGDHGRNRHQPRRGGSGILLTCEAGREKKCKREGLDILMHYYHCQTTDPSTIESKRETAGKKLSLDEEIAQLKRQNIKGDRENDAIFQEYDTSCRGTIVLLCTLPDCNLIPPNSSQEKKKRAQEQDDDESERNEVTVGVHKKARLVPSTKTGDLVEPESIATEGTVAVATAAVTPAIQSTTPPWDPVQTVSRILQDLRESKTGMPSSRFVTRMIPLQATCFASLEEIRATAKDLIAEFIPFTTTNNSSDTTKRSFCVAVKRRICSNVTRDDVIQAIVGNFEDKDWKVDLENADYTIWVEICQTLCGISVIKNVKAFSNFNLVAVREQQQEREGRNPSDNAK